MELWHAPHSKSVLHNQLESEAETTPAVHTVSRSVTSQYTTTSCLDLDPTVRTVLQAIHFTCTYDAGTRPRVWSATRVIWNQPSTSMCTMISSPTLTLTSSSLSASKSARSTDGQGQSLCGQQLMETSQQDMFHRSSRAAGTSTTAVSQCRCYNLV